MKCKNCGKRKKSHHKPERGSYKCWDNQLCGQCAFLLMPEIYPHNIRVGYGEVEIIAV